MLEKGRQFIEKIQSDLRNKEPNKIEIYLDAQLIAIDKNGFILRTSNASESGEKPSTSAESEKNPPVESVKEHDKLDEDHLCCICYLKKAEIVFIPCGHLVTCASCTSSLKTCCVCRAVITECVKVFFA